MLAHIAGVPVEEMLPLVYGASGVGAFAHLAARWRRASRRRQPASPAARKAETTRGPDAATAEKLRR